MDSIWPFIGFNTFVLAMLALDLFGFHRKAHQVSLKEAAAWSTGWVCLALSFAVGVYFYLGRESATAFLTGYIIEEALSVDNIFVFVVIFTYFRVPPQFQHRVLFWGILGALVMRGVMIGAGVYFISRFHWLLYLLGGFLVITGLRMLTQGEEPIEVENNPVLRLVRRFVPLSGAYHGQKFIVKERTATGAMRRVATPLFVVLVMVETTDVVFAVDSIPAVFSVTQDPFIVYTSNIFAILGLRAMYFLLAGVVHKLHYLKFGLSVILMFIGIKMLIVDYYAIPITLSLGLVGVVLAISVAASIIWPAKAAEQDAEGDPLKPGPEAGAKAPASPD